MASPTRQPPASLGATTAYAAIAAGGAVPAGRASVRVLIASVVAMVIVAAGVAIDVSSRPALAALPLRTTASASRHVSIDTLPRTWIEMKNVDLCIATDAVVGIRQLRGEVISAQRGNSAILDSTSSFAIRITSGTVAIQSADLSVILNKFVFGYKGSPLKHLRVRMAGAQMVQSGVMHKGVDIKFEITSSLSLTDSGFIRLHPTKVRVLGVNGESLLHVLGMKLDDLLDLSGSKAARVKGDEIFLDPTKILPPPAIDGRLTSVRVEGDALVQEFARLPEDSLFTGYARPDSAAPNYLFFRGGRLRFGRLEMRDTQLQILDLDPSDPFDLFLAEYNKQLVAGYSRNRPNLSLQAFFPDFPDIGRAVTPPIVRLPNGP
jgi:hypothetical protein